MTSSNRLQPKLPLSGKLHKNIPRKKSVSDFFYHLVAFTVKLILRVNGGLDIKGKNNIPMEGGVIIASNHISYLDPPLIGSVVPRRATFMARKGLFDILILGWLVKHYAFPVDRGKTTPSSMKEAVRRLKNGELIVMFPEGRRSETGELMAGKRGIGMVACMSNAMVVPALIIGANKVLPVDAKWLKRAKISVIFDSPFDPSTVKGEGRNLHENISQKIMYAIGDLKKRYADNSC